MATLAAWALAYSSLAYASLQILPGATWTAVIMALGAFLDCTHS
jgi:hypothetical protein